MEGEWSCCRGGQFNGGTMVVTKDTGGRIVVMDVDSLKKGEWLIQRWPV